MARVTQASRQFGFTLIEMLIVIALMGILGAGALSIFARESRRAQVQSVRSQLVLDLQYARSNAQRYNCNWTVTFVSVTQYTVIGPTLGGTTIACGTTTTTTRDIPTSVGVQLRWKTASTSTEPTGQQVIYRAPFGTLLPTNNSVIEIGLATSNTAPVTNPAYLKIIGITGKVVASEAY
jgi:prepilin-type N-terminal cleavage/methylation domain-containing protein